MFPNRRSRTVAPSVVALAVAVVAVAAVVAVVAPTPGAWAAAGCEARMQDSGTGPSGNTAEPRGVSSEFASDTLRRVSPEEVGMDPVRLASVDSLIEAAIAEGVTPGAALAIGRRGGLVRLRGYGSLDTRAGFGAATDSTLYDLASLTKVVGTTTAIMLLEEAGLIDLDAPLSRYLPEWRGSEAKARVTPRHLLAHTAGLVPFSPLWRELRGAEAFIERVAGLALVRAPGGASVYSDFGPILLGAVVERVSGEPLDAFLDARVFAPLGLRESYFNPLDRDSALLDRIAPTEYDAVYRGRHVHGEVHDENAHAMGGVAGHAGLFSSARDLAVFAQMMLNGGRYADVEFVSSETIARYTRRQGPSSSRALGWDTPGAPFSPRAYGHTGFTGTSLWIDPEHDLFVILLTNRVNPTRANTGHVRLRRDVHEAVIKAIR